VVRAGDHPFSVVVDDIVGHQQIVIKKLGAEVRDLKGVTGGAILGDGRAALILDLVELSERGKPSSASARGAA
jgi:chemotaxis protein histidine kinase CheA